MKRHFPWFILFSASLIFFPVPGAAIPDFSVDKDGDGVADWDDYCPDTPAGKKVWTKAAINKHGGDKRWAGCAGDSEQPSLLYVPPSRKTVLAKNPKQRLVEQLRSAPGAEKGLSDLTQSLSYSFGQMSTTTIKARSLIFKKAQELLNNRVENKTVSGVLDTLCGNLLIIEIAYSVIEGTSSKRFKTIIVRAKRFRELLKLSVGNSCRGYTVFGVSAMLHLLQSGVTSLAMLGGIDAELKETAEIKAAIKQSFSQILSKDLKHSLKQLLSALENAKNMMNGHLASEYGSGIVQMVLAIQERVRQFVASNIELEQVGELSGAEGITVGISSALVQAARFSGQLESE